MITLERNAGDIVLFNGALVHAGAGYVGEVYMRVHFYTSSTEHWRIWHVANKTELVQCNE
jgi:ectoine hydroxylase-related dioxygenase (phytanoyl-CoA dioxygenase family)